MCLKRIVAVLLITSFAFGVDAIRNSALSAGLKAIPANQYEIDKLIDTNPKPASCGSGGNAAASARENYAPVHESS